MLEEQQSMHRPFSIIQTNGPFPTGSPPSDQAAQEQSTISAQLAADGHFTESIASNNEGDVNTADNPNDPFPNRLTTARSCCPRAETMISAQFVAGTYLSSSAPPAGAGSWNPSPRAGNQLADTADDPKRTFAERCTTSGPG